MFLLFKSQHYGALMMILMWSNIGFKLSARVSFPGNFQAIKSSFFGSKKSRGEFFTSMPIIKAPSAWPLLPPRADAKDVPCDA